VVLLAERQHLRKSYRNFCEEIEVCNLFLVERCLRRAPHWTNLNKSSKRANTMRLERLLLVFLKETRLKALHLTVDSKGFSPTSMSKYYTRAVEQRTGMPRRPRRRRPTRYYPKQTMAVETRKRLIVTVEFRVGPTNDSPYFSKVLKKVELANHPAKLSSPTKAAMLRGITSTPRRSWAQRP
jgi:hypothetical protein